jgi:octaprenyl-diphosphate synthase
MKFTEITANLALDLKKIDDLILEFAIGKSPLIKEISNHLIAAGGKRIRPVLLLLSANLFSNKEVHNLAAAVELIHSATLLHDDVVDNSQIRRGKKTANAIWDNKSSILVGDYLFSIAFQLMVRSGNLQVLDLLSKASSIMADGEVMQLENSSNIAISKEKYLEIIFGKTAVLFSAACKSAALASNASSLEAEALSEFGKNLGIIFQIVDDILDYFSKENILGKDLGNDFFEGKVTLPIILTYSRADLRDKKIIEEIFSNNLIATEKNYNDLALILSLIEKYCQLESLKEEALFYKAKALDNLKIFPESKQKEALIATLDYALSRLF